MLLQITISGNVLAGILGPAIGLALLQIGLLIGALATTRANARHNKEQVDRLEKMISEHMSESAKAVTNLARLEVTVGNVTKQLERNGKKTDEWRTRCERRLTLLEQRPLVG